MLPEWVHSSVLGAGPGDRGHAAQPATDASRMQGLSQDRERARAALVDVIGPKIMLQPDASGRFLWAEFDFETAPLLAGTDPQIMVAGAC